MNILTDFSDTLVSAITILYVLTSFTVLLSLCQKLRKAKFTIDLLRNQQHVYTVKPNRPAPPPPPNPSDIDTIFVYNLRTIQQIQFSIKKSFDRIEKEHRPPSYHELQYLRSMRRIISTLEMVESDIESCWVDYTKNLNPKKTKSNDLHYSAQ